MQMNIRAQVKIILYVNLYKYVYISKNTLSYLIDK